MTQLTTSVDRVTGKIGAQVSGVDLREVSAGLAGQLREWLAEYLVLFFRDQQLDDDAQVALAGMLGPVGEVLGRSIFPIRTDAGSPTFADEWHTDLSLEPEPPAFAALRGVTIPPQGGDTVWASLIAAYERLSEPMRALADGLAVHHGVTLEYLRSLRITSGPAVADREAQNEGAVHPLVLTHPVTGRKSLYLSPRYMTSIEGLHPAESRSLLELLAGLLDDPSIQVRWRWRPGDVVIWDERYCAHRALNDHFPQARLLMRTTVNGAPLAAAALTATGAAGRAR